MTGEPNGFEALEHDLTRLGRYLDHPATPDLAARVAGQLRPAPGPTPGCPGGRRCFGVPRDGTARPAHRPAPALAADAARCARPVLVRAQRPLDRPAGKWSADFPGGHEEPVPSPVVTARRLDGEAPEFRSERATNGYHPSFHWAMLVWVKLPSPGCWEFSARYRDHQLRFVVRVP
jgi:hypothetical protein